MNYQKKPIYLLLLLLFLMVVNCSEEDPGLTFKGKVVDIKSKQPIEGALVIISAGEFEVIELEDWRPLIQMKVEFSDSVLTNNKGEYQIWSKNKTYPLYKIDVKKDAYLKSKGTAFLPDIRRINSYNIADTVFVGTETGIKIVTINEDQNEEDQIGFSIKTVDPDYTVGNGSTIEDGFFSAQQLSGDSISSQMISQQGGDPNNFIVERRVLFEMNKLIELNITRKNRNGTTTELETLPMIEGIIQEIVLYY